MSRHLYFSSINNNKCLNRPQRLIRYCYDIFKFDVSQCTQILIVENNMFLIHIHIAMNIPVFNSLLSYFLNTTDFIIHRPMWSTWGAREAQIYNIIIILSYNFYSVANVCWEDMTWYLFDVMDWQVFTVEQFIILANQQWCGNFCFTTM